MHPPLDLDLPLSASLCLKQDEARPRRLPTNLGGNPRSMSDIRFLSRCFLQDCRDLSSVTRLRSAWRRLCAPGTLFCYGTKRLFGHLKRFLSWVKVIAYIEPHFHLSIRGCESSRYGSPRSIPATHSWEHLRFCRWARRGFGRYLLWDGSTRLCSHSLFHSHSPSYPIRVMFI